MLPGMENTNRTWSPQQTAIFNFFKTGRGNLVVRARAGTGKTTTIIEAVKHAPQDKILLAAFNKRIATELTNRIGSTSNVEAKTLHALGFAFIRRQWKDVKVDASVDVDRARVVCGGKNAPDEMVVIVKKLAGLLKNVQPFATDFESIIPVAEQFDCIPDEEWQQDGWDAERICSLAIAARDAAKERDEHGRISFDDMVFIPLANDFARPWFTLVCIDEAQDMNYAQLLLAQRACKRIGRIVVVGDDAQAIYGFRGADSDGIDRLKHELNATELGLTVTYRCGKKIVDIAAKMVPDFRAHADNADGTIDGCDNEKLLEAAQPGDFVLSRKNAPLMPLCLAFLKRGVRARIEGRDIGAGLRAIVIKFKARSVPQFIERVQGWAAKQTARIEKLTDATAREDRLAQIEDQTEMLIALAEGCVSVEEILRRTDTLFGDSEGAPPAIVCSSVHKAKGLEAERVFILVDTLRSGSREERNIFYVAVTRAKAHLTWVVDGEKQKR